MNIYLQLLLVAAIVVFVVDLSGFTQSWRSLLAQALHIQRLKPLPPFDCSLCMVWWVTLIYAVFQHQFTLPIVAYCALLSYLSIPLAQVIIFIREILLWLLNKLMP